MISYFYRLNITYGIIMDLFIAKLEEFLQQKTEIVNEYMKENEKEKKQIKGSIVDAGMTYDMQKFLKTVREFEAEQKKKSKKRVKDNTDI